MGLSYMLPSQPERSVKESMSQIALLGSGMLGVWLGLIALRAYLFMVVFNVAEDKPPLFMGLVALGVWAVGLSGWVPARLLGGSRPAWRFGLLLAVLTCARQALPGEILSPALAFASIIAWLWWFPAYLKEAARAGTLRWVASALILGLAAEVAGQTALNGLNFVHWTGVWSVLTVLLLSGGFVAALWKAVPVGEVSKAEREAGESAAGRGVLLIGPYLFLQITYLTHLSLTHIETGWSLAAVSALVQAGLLAGLLALLWNPPRFVRVGLGLVAVGVLFAGQLSGFALLALIPMQAGLAVALGAALTPDRPGWRALYSLHAIGAMAFFVLFFVYTASWGMTSLWSIAGAMVVTLGALRSGAIPSFSSRSVLVAAAIAALGIGLSLIPHPSATAPSGKAPRELKVLNYNIHQGLDYFSAPSVMELATFIEAEDPDLIALQEVPRGSTSVSGGSDLILWLRWRFPAYQIAGGPHHSDLYVNAVMSRYPITSSGSLIYGMEGSADVTSQARNPRGLVWASVQSEAGPVLFVSTHLSSYGYALDRDSQAQELLSFWSNRPRTVLAGDWNALLDEEPVRKTIASGLTDTAAEQGLGDSFTYSSGKPTRRIDYIFVTPDFAVTAAAALQTLVSDHLPITATLRLR